MWARNLLFWTLCGGGALAMGASLLVPGGAPEPAAADLAVVQTDAFQETLRRVDDEFRRRWVEEQLQPTARASDLAIARRLSLGLCGTVPSLEEIRQFEARPAEGRIAWWTARLLADRRHADHLAERLARAYVGVEDGPFLIYRRRRFVTWLSDEIHAGRPYDQLVRKLIADEGLWTDAPATNFVTVTVDQNGTHQPDADKLAGRTARAFLGVRLDCVQCHDDHLGGPWKRSDYQGLAAFFGGTRQTFTGIRDGDGEYRVKLIDMGDDGQSSAGEVVAPCVPFFQDLPTASAGSRREQLAAWLTNPGNKAFARAAVNRTWAVMFGRPLVDPIDSIPLEDPPPVLDILATDFVAHGYDLRRLVQLIAATEVFRLDRVAKVPVSGHQVTYRHEHHWAAFPLVRLRPEQVAGAVMQSASLQTIDHDSHIVTRFARSLAQSEFLRRYGDTGEDEFEPAGGTIPQRLVMMNGQLVYDQTKEGLLTNAGMRIAALSRDDATAVETAYLAVLTRRPTDEEAEHFTARLAEFPGQRTEAILDLFWTLYNSTEFSWNH